MSPVQHRVTGAALSFSLQDEMTIVRGELARAPTRIARTLVKEGPLRVTVVGLHAGGSLREHSTDGPLTIHVLDGAIDVVAAGKTWPLATGQLLALDGGVAHTVTSAGGAIFLLTVMQVGASRAR